MNKFAIVVWSLGALGLLQSAAKAAHPNYPTPVTIYKSPTSALAQGSFQREIGCEVSADSAGASRVFCGATEASGNAFYCSMSNPSPAIRRAVDSIDATSEITVAADPHTNTCTSISVSKN
jgi:hypothetical protein